MNGESIERVDKFYDLGLVFSSKLSFSDDSAFRTAKAKITLGLIKRLTASLGTLKKLLTLYTSLVRSKLEYSNIIWSPTYSYIRDDSGKKIQRRFLHFLDNYSNLNYDELCQKYDVEKLQDRRNQNRLCFAMTS